MFPLQALLLLTCQVLFFGLAFTSAAQSSRYRSATEYYNRGNERQQQGDVKGALEDYTIAITFDASFAPAWNNRGVVRFLNREAEAAIASVRRHLGKE